jgi:hypothetical protein
MKTIKGIILKNKQNGNFVLDSLNVDNEPSIYDLNYYNIFKEISVDIEEEQPKFKVGDKVKDKYGNLGVVQQENSNGNFYVYYDVNSYSWKKPEDLELVQDEAKKMNFMEAVEAIGEGKKVTRDSCYYTRYWYLNEEGDIVTSDTKRIIESADLFAFVKLNDFIEVPEEKKTLSEKEIQVDQGIGGFYKKDVKEFIKDILKNPTEENIKSLAGKELAGE